MPIAFSIPVIGIGEGFWMWGAPDRPFHIIWLQRAMMSRALISRMQITE